VVEGQNHISHQPIVIDGNHRLKACKKLLNDPGLSDVLKFSVRYVPAIVLSRSIPVEYMVTLGTSANVTSRQQLQDTLLTRAQLLRNIARNKDVLIQYDKRYCTVWNRNAKRQDENTIEMNNGIASMILKQRETSTPAPNTGTHAKSSPQTAIGYLTWAMYPCLLQVVELEKNQVGDSAVLTYSKVYYFF